MNSKIDKKMENYREPRENMSSTLIEQSSKFVKSHVETTMFVLQETNLNTRGLFVGWFWVLLPLSSQFQANTPLCDFEIKNNIFSSSFAFVSHETSNSEDTPKDISIIPNPPFL